MLGADTVLLLEPRVGDLMLGEPRIWDPSGIAELAAGDLILGINFTPADAAAVLEQLAAAHISALALKGDADTLAKLATAAAKLKIAVLAVSATMSWDQFYTLVLNATVRGAASDDTSPMSDLFALANAMAANIGAAITIEDPRGGLLAYSNLDQPIDEARRDTILGRRIPTAWSRVLEGSGYYRQLSSSIDGIVRIQDVRGVLRNRMAILIKAGAEVLGSVWAVEGDEPFDARAEESLRDATRLAAMHLLRHRAFIDSSRGERGAVLRDLLEHGASGTDYGGTLGIRPDVACIVVAFRLIEFDDDVELTVARGRVIDAITVAGEAFRRRVVCTWIGETVYALFPSTTAEHTARLVSMADEICRQFGQRHRVHLIAGVSSVSTDLAGTRECRHEADRVVRVLLEENGRLVAAIDDVRVASLLLTLAEITRSRPEFQLPGIDQLIAHDLQRSKSYLATLQAYVDCGGNISDVATKLNLHTNTVRYRIGRLEQISGLRLDDPADRLAAAVDLLNRTLRPQGSFDSPS